MKLKIGFLILVSVTAVSAAEFQDKPADAVASIRRTFKVSASDCKKAWEVSSEADSSYCAVNVQDPAMMKNHPAIIDAEHVQFSCSVKEGSSSKSFTLEIVPHGTFGYLVQAQGQVLFASIERCLNDEILKLPNQEVSVTFAMVKAK